MSGRIVYFNGQFLPEADARISIFDSGVVTGDMVFESTRTFRGQPFQLETHLDRLFGSLEILQMNCGLTKEELKSLTFETLDRNRETESPDMEWQIIHNISPGPAEVFQAAFAEGIHPTVCINCWPLIPQLGRLAREYTEGVSLVIPEQRALPPRLMNPHAKTRSRAHAKIAQIQANQIEPGAWALLLDEADYLAEGPSWNIFLVREGRLLTPTTRNVLPGVSRTITIQLAHELGIPVEETNIKPGEAHTAQEMFCTATSFCVIPVRSIDGTRLTANCPGPITQQLSEAWQKHVGVDFIAQAQDFAGRLIPWREKELAAQTSTLSGDA
ncbi:MAG: aminotransferase class IV [Planctomycetaceae bacterium]|nr:aminotransferase class IV [Planctomycetaceae bacterium]